MKILAFLLSPSDSLFYEGTANWIIEKYRDDLDYHRMRLKESMTGRRLYEAFGDLFDVIIWDNVNPYPATDFPDQKHIGKVIAKHSPDLIITFGETAKKAIYNSTAWLDKPTMNCHHPNARYRTQSDLNTFALEVRNYMLNEQRGVSNEKT